MPDFTFLKIGHKYDRPSLARLWGYRSHHAIGRGVFSPRGENVLIFFVTKEKQQTFTQYIDHIEADILFWEGEKGHGNDKRIVSQRDTIHIFYRDRHHADFTYEGRAALRGYHLCTDRPSKFTFQLIDKMIGIQDMVAEIRNSYGLTETEKDAIVKSRIGQGLYRKKVIDLWQTCSVTGFTKEPVLVASHVKPWRSATNEERINPFNSLLLVPTLDKLFDNGYLGFEQNGKIMLSDKIEQKDWGRIGVDTSLRLRNVP